ncbi:MAG: N-acylglucosamine 2-epimerase [Mucilaginibacter sp.]|nr:N-acylglucosamine 2-epimerase [Mucilaginibacter sp.]
MITTATDRFALQNAFKLELENILNYWSTCAIDDTEGGFYGELTNDNQPIPGAVKGSVLNARILWSFSSAYNLTKDLAYLSIAKRALIYIRSYFIDPLYGGVYWSVTAKGEPADTKKQLYALAFTIYGLSEYYKATKEEDALSLALSLYRDIEKYSFDADRGGYFEAFTREWKLIDDLRLSDKDANEKKTMNTHLHILEAYTTLYHVWPDDKLGLQIRRLLQNFEEYIVDAISYHLVLFFDENWQVRSETISYGHDIEASWLLLEAAEALGDKELVSRIKQLAVKIAIASAQGLNADGSMNYEYEPLANHLIAEKHWWVQAEAVVGFYNAYQVTGEEAFFDKAVASWDFTQKHIIDHQKGEWLWGVNNDGTVMSGYGKVSFWKCPYHNSRACMEMITRLEKITNKF